MGLLLVNVWNKWLFYILRCYFLNNKWAFSTLALLVVNVKGRISVITHSMSRDFCRQYFAFAGKSESILGCFLRHFHTINMTFFYISCTSVLLCMYISIMLHQNAQSKVPPPPPFLSHSKKRKEILKAVWEWYECNTAWKLRLHSSHLYPCLFVHTASLSVAVMPSEGRVYISFEARTPRWIPWFSATAWDHAGLKNLAAGL